LQFAELRIIGGYSGSYWDQLGPRAEIDVTGATFQSKGTAAGLVEQNPGVRITRAFSRVAW